MASGQSPNLSGPVSHLKGRQQCLPHRAVFCEDYVTLCGWDACYTHRNPRAPLLVPICSQLENTPCRGPSLLNVRGLLTGTALFLLQRPCLLETHYTFLFLPHTSQPIQVAASPLMSPRYDLPSVSSCAAGGSPPCLADSEWTKGDGKGDAPCIRVPEGSQCPRGTSGFWFHVSVVWLLGRGL